MDAAFYYFQVVVAVQYAAWKIHNEIFFFVACIPLVIFEEKRLGLYRSSFHTNLKREV